ncbi:PREDICTED: syntaxin-1A-like [Aptenodytes forsteri]|uniref:syntaxin-1A-like n=1 Tax=Aptenodytes forsteri TaxID=9233 RepID=UPI0004F4775A|nr:PREDICTED: syntaxin-1A-like [Aptenodytes forsteri]
MESLRAGFSAALRLGGRPHPEWKCCQVIFMPISSHPLSQVPLNEYFRDFDATCWQTKWLFLRKRRLQPGDGQHRRWLKAALASWPARAGRCPVGPGVFGLGRGQMLTVTCKRLNDESRYWQRLKEQIGRQAELAGIALEAKDLDRLAESPEAPRIVGRDLEDLKAKQHLAAAQACQRQLLDLEMQMAELHGLFLRLEGLLAEQPGAADSVEHYVLRTLDYVAQTGGEVKKAFKYQRPSRLSALLTAALSLCACCTCLPCLSGADR